MHDSLVRLGRRFSANETVVHGAGESRIGHESFNGRQWEGVGSAKGRTGLPSPLLDLRGFVGRGSEG
jgi:hypothetical protein